MQGGMMKLFKGPFLAVFVVFLLISGCGGGSGGGGGDAKDSSSVYSQLGATVNSLKFYEGGRDGVPLETRKYDNFQKETTRFVFYELNLEYPKPEKETQFSLKFVCHKPDGAILSEVIAEFTVPPDWAGSILTTGYGWNTPGNWLPGEYTVKVYDIENSNLITTGAFTIGDDAAPILTVPSIIDYHPASGPAGSYVALLFDEPTLLDLAADLKAFYNGSQIPVSGIAEESIQVVVPLDAASGNIEVRAGDSASNKVHFSVEEMVVSSPTFATIDPSSEQQIINFGDVISVTIPPGFLDKTRRLSVSDVINPPPKIINPYGHSRIFDVSIDEMAQLDDYIKISMKYDPALLNPDYGAEEQLAAMRWDDDGQFWVMLPYRVDEDSQLIHFYTDHLSLVGWVVVSNPGLSAVSWVAREARNDVYVTPQGNIRILYSRKNMDADPWFSGSTWDRYGPNIVSISYRPSHPKYIQDIGEVFEIALDNFRHKDKAGFKDPAPLIEQVDPVFGNHRYRSPVTVKIDSWFSKAVGLGVRDPQYEKIFQNIHLPVDEFKQFASPFGSYAVIGHEFFHRIQAEYYGRTGFLKSANYWWIESTAEYAGSRVAWEVKHDCHERGIQSDFLAYSINTKGVPTYYWGDRYYEYAASVFIQFLCEVKGLNFKDMFEYVAGGEPFARLSEFISSKDIWFLKDYYAQFAAWSVFSQNSFLKNFKIADFSYKETTSDEIVEKKDEIQLSDNNFLNIQVAGGSGMFVDVFKLAEGERLPGDGFPSPLMTLRNGDETDYEEAKHDDVLYFMAINNGKDDNSITVTVTVKNEDGDDLTKKSHTFSLKGNYSAKLWAIKIAGDVVLTITPDEITDGRADQEYTFQLNAEHIPEEVRRVYFEWNFGDSQSHSIGKSIGVWVSDGSADLDVSHTFASGKRECIVVVSVHDAFTDEKLAEATATITFYTISIQGPRHIIYELTGGATEVTHEFEAEFSPPGLYSFLWEFDDGQSNGFSNIEIGNRVTISHTYTGLKAGDKFYPSVKLYSQDGNTLLAEDSITIRVNEETIDGGYWSLADVVEEPGLSELFGYDSTKTATWADGSVTGYWKDDNPAPGFAFTDNVQLTWSRPPVKIQSPSANDQDYILIANAMANGDTTRIFGNDPRVGDITRIIWSDSIIDFKITARYWERRLNLWWHYPLEGINPNQPGPTGDLGSIPGTWNWSSSTYTMVWKEGGGPAGQRYDILELIYDITIIGFEGRYKYIYEWVP